MMSRLTQARGLKLAELDRIEEYKQVAPHAGAWIETEHRHVLLETAKLSRLTQARGLKRLATGMNDARPTSRLTQARGLKQAWLAQRRLSCLVAPHAGAWIETLKV